MWESLCLDTTMNLRICLYILSFIILIGCQSSGKPRKAVVVSVELTESNPNEAIVYVIHNVKSTGQLKELAKLASKGILNCESGQMTRGWLKDDTAPQHNDFPDGQKSVSLVLNCIM